ncbi:TPA: nucleoside-diphosphate kinase [Candidatus Woesearchaeota archaeon]|nr:nucleoside-diphosphate kinase [Candidatus Woesearchaeota archaeon]
MVERTLVLFKPDAVQRAIMGRILSRFEDAGLKVVGMKMAWVDKKFALKHYTEDLAKRAGAHVREMIAEFLTTGPVVAMVLEGVNAIENVRKLVGSTEPKSAAPGTIRGDFSHVSYAYADAKKAAVKNLVHASSDKEDAAAEIGLWFTPRELHSYRTVHDIHLL